MMSNQLKHIFALETSCDETAAAVLEFSQDRTEHSFKILSNIVASQIQIHKKWGGVYPELASRAHLESIIPVIEQATKPIGGIKKFGKNIDAISYTKEPGLIGSLLIGIETAKILGAYFKKPIISINHLEGHIYAAFCGKIKSEKPKIKGEIENSKFEVSKSGIFPILALIVSGGHTSLILMKDHLQYQTVGETIDDAAGEAFDKVARIIGLSYPGGPEIEKIAKSGNGNAYDLPIAMKDSSNLNFSFSGLKTAVLYLTKDPATGKGHKFNKADLAASFQETVAQILALKTNQAIKKYNPETVIFTGGVSANSYLRDYLSNEISKITHAKILIPHRNLSTDNAVGIAIAGAIKFSKNKKSSWRKLDA